MNGDARAAVVAVHQPEHLPWLGFFAKMDAADLLVSLDIVPFRKNYFQNRNRILGPDGGPLWLTVPVRLDGHLAGEIRTVRIAEDGRWRRKYLRTVEQRYGRHPHFREHFEPLARVLEAEWSGIAALNLALIDALRRPLGIHTPIVRASDLGVTGTRSELLAAICRRLGAAVYLSGPSGREYLDPTPFEAAGIRIAFHDYDHPVYRQRGCDGFVSHLSAVDLLFNCGPGSAEILRAGRRIG
ncbi:MAG TPA: WbqC family protein [Longimicrobiales bacterium]